MRLCSFAVCAGMAMTTVAAQAQAAPQTPKVNQIGIYFTPTASRISNSTADTGVFAFLGPNNTSNFFEGIAFGAYDDFYHSQGFNAGLDARVKILRGDGAQLTSFLIGARFEFKPVSVPFKPYVQVSGGVGGSKPAHNPRSISKPEYEGAVGVDYPLGRLVDFRVAEIGYGSVQTISSATLNGSSTLPSSSRLINISTGIVFRLP